MTVKLRPYQQQKNQEVYNSWKCGNKNIMLVHPTGAGKTVCMSDIVHNEQGSVCVIAHRQELVSQISIALARNGIVHRIIGPSKIVKMICSMHMREFGKLFYNHQSHIAVAGVDTLIRRGKELRNWLPTVKLWVIDECFPAGTMVDDKPIETIEVGDYVTAFNENTGEFSKRKVTRLFKNPMPGILFSLFTTGKKHVTSTAKHPYWTKRGWKYACDLVKGDKLLNDENEWVELKFNFKVLGKKSNLHYDHQFVYNIEVDELHTYTANGIVVHNCHHTLTDNKWGKAVEMFPNARGLGVTATPLRADGKGLGADNDGEFHDMVVGPSMRDLINQGFLTEYRVFAPVNNMSFDDARISKATGDYNKNDIDKIVAQSSLVVHEKSTMVGDVVGHYLKIAKGKLGITFVPSMDTGREIEAQFNAVGVPAILVNAKTPDDKRAEIIRKFAKREYLQLINVDLFGEGFDLPSLEVVSMARPTQSYGLFVQMFGRVLRLMEGKTHGIVIDHVGNCARHGLPDAPREWTLDRKSKSGSSSDSDVVPVKSCPMCTFVYERFKKACPDCGHVPIPSSRESIEYVDGDLSELSPEALAIMRGEIDKTDRPIDDQVEEYNQSLHEHTKPLHRAAHVKRIRAKLIHQRESQVTLREKMAMLGGYWRQEGMTDSEIYRRFYFTIGGGSLDWLSAMKLDSIDAENLSIKINTMIQSMSG